MYISLEDVASWTQFAGPGLSSAGPICPLRAQARPSSARLCPSCAGLPLSALGRILAFWSTFYRVLPFLRIISSAQKHQEFFNISPFLYHLKSSMSLIKPLRLLLLGAPGSGKGTQTSKLLKQFPHIHTLSSGDILRSQISLGTKIGAEAQQYIKSGQLVPDSTMVGLITNHLKDSSWLHEQSNWLLDGFPRTANQAKELDKVLVPAQSSLNLVVELDVDQSVILERIEARWVHLPSGRIYNLDYNPPKVPYKDDITGEPLSKREDDTAAVFQKRLDQYNREIESLKGYYLKSGIYHTVSGNSSDIIYPKLASLILDRFAK